MRVHDDRRQVESLDFVPQFGDSDYEGGVGIPDLVGELGDGVAGVGGGGYGADGNDGEEAEGEGDGVGGKDEDDVASVDAQEAGEAVGDSGDGGFELGKGEGVARVGVGECEVVGVGGGAAEEEGDHGGFGVFGEDERGTERPVDAVSAVP